MPVIATAGWSISKHVAHRFPEAGSVLNRYASVFDGVEINSTFYRHHQVTTFERWANAVPDDFLFAVKLPREITHTRRLLDVDQPFERFILEVSGLGDKLGPVLCQLPPSLKFDARVAAAAFETMRATFSGLIVIEPRHVSWATQLAEEVLMRYAVGRVLADPAPVWSASDFSDSPQYVRLHGTPKIYYSNYSVAKISSIGRNLDAGSWCVFDNTASGAAIENALAMRDELGISAHRED